MFIVTSLKNRVDIPRSPVRSWLGANFFVRFFKFTLSLQLTSAPRFKSELVTSSRQQLPALPGSELPRTSAAPSHRLAVISPGQCRARRGGSPVSSFWIPDSSFFILLLDVGVFSSSALSCFVSSLLSFHQPLFRLKARLYRLQQPPAIHVESDPIKRP